MPRLRNSKRISYVVSLLLLVLSAQMGVAEVPSGSKDRDWGIVIQKKDITSTAKFYPYTVNGKPMEIFAVKALDGTIRTALNTCQVCYSSGRGYYKQEGRVFVCQNCGNRFGLDQIEKVRGGCNPIPILSSDKTDLGDSIGVSKAYLEKAAPYFARWKR